MQQQRQYRSELDRNFKTAVQGSREIQQGDADDEMAGRGNGQEFAQAFENAEQDGGECISHQQHS